MFGIPLDHYFDLRKNDWAQRERSRKGAMRVWPKNFYHLFGLNTCLQPLGGAAFNIQRKTTP